MIAAHIVRVHGGEVAQHNGGLSINLTEQAFRRLAQRVVRESLGHSPVRLSHRLLITCEHAASDGSMGKLSRGPPARLPVRPAQAATVLVAADFAIGEAAASGAAPPGSQQPVPAAPAAPAAADEGARTVDVDVMDFAELLEVTKHSTQCEALAEPR